MAFDLDYLITECDHKIKDDIVQKAIDFQSTQIDGDAIFGEDIFGNEWFGDAFYYLGNYSFGSTGTYIEAVSEPTIIAILPLKYEIASAPQLYTKAPTDYLRFQVPETSYTSYVITIYYNGHHFYGDGSIYGSEGYEDSSTPYTLWKVVYGDPSTTYSVTMNGQTLSDVPGNSIIIARYLNLQDWIVDYTVKVEKCPKCLGEEINNDMYFTPRGKLALAMGTDKLVQIISKSVLTDKGTNPYFSWYGSVIKDLLTENVDSNIFVLRAEIIEQLNNIKSIQQNVMEVDPGFYTSSEILEDLVDIISTPLTDPRAMSIKVVVLTRTLQEVHSKKLSIIRR